MWLLIVVIFYIEKGQMQTLGMKLPTETLCLEKKKQFEALAIKYSKRVHMSVSCVTPEEDA